MYSKNCFTCKKRETCWFYKKAEPLLLRCNKFQANVGKFCKSYETTYKAIIVNNKIRCKKCNQVIESKHVHDYVTCSCGSVSVDGGRDYLKRSGNIEDMVELSEIKYITPEEYDKLKQQQIKARKAMWKKIDPELLLAFYDTNYKNCNWKEKKS
jgi:hypothetical protein